LDNEVLAEFAEEEREVLLFVDILVNIGKVNLLLRFLAFWDTTAD